MNGREFHITDLPSDRVFVLLKDEFRIRFFKYIDRNYGFVKFNKLFFNSKLKYPTYKQWRRCNIKVKTRVKKLFIPLWFLIKISELFKDIFSIKEIETNIIAYKGPSVSNVFYYPEFPLKEDERMLRILAHLIGDGHVSGAFGTLLPKGRGSSDYRNFCNELLYKFEKDMSVFGQVNLSKDYNHGHVIVPNLIPYILEYIYQIKFDCLSSRVPESLYNLSSDLVAAFIRAFFDDECHVYDNHTDVYSINKKLLEDFMQLFKLKFPQIKISELKVNKHSKNHKYYFYVLAESREEYLKSIGFDHPQKKEDLIFNIRRMSNYKNGVALNSRNGVLNHLKDENLTAKELSRKLNVSHGTALLHLRKLLSNGKVKIFGKKKTSNLWSIK